MCSSSSDLFGCVGLRKKQYCIFNKQYAKEEYEELVGKIKKHMDEMPYTDIKGRVYKYGEFFPIELSPFAYNETLAQEYFPLTDSEADQKGYFWRSFVEKNYNPTIIAPDLPDSIDDVQDSITKEVVGCAHEGKCNEQCTAAFRIIPDELKFYRAMKLPLPRLCPSCRSSKRLLQRTPLNVYKRECAKCGKEIETSYAPDRPEIVYCEDCYKNEVA
jgi:CxxC-x17-CxxC domain-containing protein